MESNSELELRHCRALVALADNGSITRAARSMGTAQSTLSEALLSLERILGAPVTSRGSNGKASLTRAGEALLPYARSLLADARAALHSIEEVVASERALYLRVGSVESVSSYVLPIAARELQKRLPNAGLDVTVGLCEELQEQVRRGQLDLALVLGPETDTESSDTFRRVASAQISFFAQPTDAVTRRSCNAFDLAPRNIILSDPAGRFYSMVKKWFDSQGIARPQLQSAGSIEGVKRALELGGEAVGLLPMHAAFEALERGALAEVRTSPPLPRIQLECLLGSNQIDRPAVQELLTITRSMDLIRAAQPR